MPITTYADSLLNKQLFGATAPTIAGTYYIGVSTTTPAPDGTGVTEPSGSFGYARFSVANTTAQFTPASSQPASGQAQVNVNNVTFPQATGLWGTITYLVVYDAPSAGNLIAYGPLSTQQVVTTGDTLTFLAGNLTFTLQ